MSRFCNKCGAPLRDGIRFCTKCGAPITEAPQPQPQPQYQPQSQPQPQYQPQPQAAKKSGKGAVIGIVAGLVVIALGVTGWLGFREGGFLRGGDTAAEEVKESDSPVKKSESSVKQPDEPVKTDAPEPDAPEPVSETYIFDDVSESDWYYEAVQWAAGESIVSGTTFNPTGDCTRAQALTFLWRAKGKPEPNLKVSPFTDASDGDYFYAPVLWAFENGLISLSGDGKFHPDDAATRAQAVTFLYRAEGSPKTHGTSQFSDVKDTDWFAPQAVWALEKGLLSSGGAFYPDGKASRAIYVTLLYRLYK